MDTKPAILVIFGITGDLAQRKVLPAIYHLFKDSLIHENTVILGISRRDISSKELMAQVELCVNETDNICDPVAFRKFQRALQMRQMSLDDNAGYDDLRKLLDDIEAAQGMCMDRLHFLSIPPQMFEPIVKGLGTHGLNASCTHGTATTRLLIEKPFGYDSASATTLLNQTAEWFSEEQTFRVDHYVAKNSVVDLLDFRLNRPEISDIWNNRFISNIDITAFEKIDIEGRTVFYDSIGALRDIIQSHLLQLMAIVMMDIPDQQSAAAIHASRLQLLRSVPQITADMVPSRAIRGQYEGYTDDVGNNQSITETYSEIILDVNTPDWHGVPVRLRTGKALAEKITEISITFNDGSTLLCQIQPDTGLTITNGAGATDTLADTTIAAILEQAVRAHAQSAHSVFRFADAYQRVLVDALAGKQTVFTTSPEILETWRIIDPIIQAWDKDGSSLLHYPKGSSDIAAKQITA